MHACCCALTSIHMYSADCRLLTQPTACADNVYGLLPITTLKKISVWLMIIHQFIAWSLYVTPLLYM